MFKPLVKFQFLHLQIGQYLSAIYIDGLPAFKKVRCSVAIGSVSSLLFMSKLTKTRVSRRYFQTDLNFLEDQTRVCGTKATFINFKGNEQHKFSLAESPAKCQSAEHFEELFVLWFLWKMHII